MGFDGLLITEIFHSIQGETSLSGKPFVFVRLTGCNLRCSYCDSSYAFKNGTRMSVDDVVSEAGKFNCKHVLLTGGEPLLQRKTRDLILALTSAGHTVSIETHGEVSIEGVADLARIVMDIKTPGSLMCRENFKKNLRFLKPSDEVKFVIAEPEDYYWARDLIRKTDIPTEEILFSPVTRSPGAPGKFTGVDPLWVAERILEDGLDVRLQLQLHKILWGAEKTGV